MAAQAIYRARGYVEIMSAQDLVAVARQIVDSNLYMTLGTADSVLDPSVPGVDRRSPVAI